MNRRALILESADAATEARARAGIDEFAPIDPYALAEILGASARFVDANMEGFYYRGPPARILVASQRPLRRRAFTCAHEIGHHWFGHGSTLDELANNDRAPSDDPEEIIAEAFAAFLLMPTLAIRGAFARRGLEASDATPLQVLAVASEFGVGFGTLVTHLSMTTYDLSYARRVELEKWSPKRIRRSVLQLDEAEACLFLDEKSCATSYDVEVGDLIAAPGTAWFDCSAILMPDAERGGLQTFRAIAQGCSACRVGGIDASIRVSRRAFVGRAKFRHLEEPDE